jgi:hypothetical protein
MSEEDMNDRSGSRTPDPEHYNRDIWLKSTELFGKPYQKCSSSHSTLKYSPSSISCPEMEGAHNLESLDKLSSLDMMFKSRRKSSNIHILSIYKLRKQLKSTYLRVFAFSMIHSKSDTEPGSSLTINGFRFVL